MEEFRAYCLSKRGVIESFPFDQTTLVFKLMDKKFPKRVNRSLV